MPVTRIEPNPKQTVEEDVLPKSTHTQKQVININPQGYSIPLPLESPPEASPPSQPEAPRRIIRRHKRVCKYPYTYTDPYSQFFTGVPAPFGNTQLPELHNTYLRPNARFVGEQQSGTSRYDIKVELKTVDLLSSVVTGFFQISGLTDEHPLITTCFKGEIINNPLNRLEWGNSDLPTKRYSFITEENNWSSFPKNDLEHWKNLTGCPSHYSEVDLRKKLHLIQSGKQDPLYVYMRWKEEFLLPDLRVKSLTGASFEGFYYVVLNIGSGPEDTNSERFLSNIIPGTMSGLYFYTQLEKFQSLSLRYVEDRGASQSFDFV